MGTTSHQKKTWTLTTPKAPEQAVALRSHVETLKFYPPNTEPLTFPQLRVLSYLYQSFIHAMDSGLRDHNSRSLTRSELFTRRSVLEYLTSKNFIVKVGYQAYAITEVGADEYEVQWYVADNRRHKDRYDTLESGDKNSTRKRSGKLTKAQAEQIRSSTKSGKILATLYEVSEATISNIRNNVTYTE